MSFCDNANAYVTSDYGYIYKTTNGGTNWTAIQTVTSEFQYSMKTFSPDKAISAGNKGTLLLTTNGGTNWADRSYGFRNFLYSIDFSGKENALACGAQGTVAVTTNAGQNWERIQAATTSSFLYQVEAMAGGVAYTAGSGGAFLKSTNGGYNWSGISTGLTTDIYAICFFNELTGWACGDSGTLIRTSNGGATFEIFQSDREKYITDIEFVNASTGWYSQQGGLIFKTTNGGLNWFVPHSASFDATVGGIDFFDSNTGIGFTYSNKIIITTNGGVNWSETNVPANVYLNNVFAVSGQVYRAVGDYGFSYVTTNAGQIWRQETNNNFSDRIFGMYFFDEDLGWMCGGNGLIARYQNTTVSLASGNNVSGPEGFQLFQNFPNPFNPSTKLPLMLSAGGFVEAEVFDAAGRMVAGLFNGYLESGRHEISFAAENLNSGVYFCRVSYRGNIEREPQTRTVRMILLK